MEAVSSINDQLRGFLDFIAATINGTPEFQEELKGDLGWINATFGLRSDDGLVEQTVIFQDGVVTVDSHIPERANAVFVFKKADDIMAQLEASPDEGYKMILRGRIRVEGNAIYMGLWDYLLNLVLGDDQQQAVDAQIEEHRKENLRLAENTDTSGRAERDRRRTQRLPGKRVDPGVKYLDDPYLSQYGLEDFPRVATFRDEYIRSKPEVSMEYGKLITDFFVENGYEADKDGRPWEPNLRTASYFHHIMRNRLPVIRKNDLLAGSFTPNPISGNVGHPNTLGPYIWGELHTCHARELDPYVISEETIRTFHKYVFPYWIDRTLNQLWKIEFHDSLPARIHDRYFACYYWKVISNMENSPGFERILKKGLGGLRDQIQRELADDPNADREKKNTLGAMLIGLDAVAAYTANLAAQALQEADAETDPIRKTELEIMHRILTRVPENPANTLHEAVQVLSIMHIALGMENIDDGPSFGRLDQILQPYLEADMEKLGSADEREAYIRRAIELLGCMYMKVISHWSLSPDLGNWFNSGSPLNSTIVVGGITPEGEDAVNDMTYILLKVTELCGLQDPNVHARYKRDKNSTTYLKRVCEVNYITGATPAIHGDDAMIDALSANEQWALEDIRGWTPTGCVEPSMPGKHASATSSLEFNLVAPLEMALNNGVHPLMGWDLGPKTGDVTGDDFQTFEDFWAAWKTQAEFMFDQSINGNNELGEVYQRHMPGPLLSALMDGCIESGRGYTRGGAKYNSSGVSVIGLSDVVDSLTSIKRLVFDEERVTFKQMKEAIDANFQGHEPLHAMIKSRVPRFGSGDPEALEMANRVTKLTNDYYRNRRNYRGGHYATGWWSMNNHTVYGRVTGALPSGKLDGEPFTPGLTPHPSASNNMLDNLMDVAGLDPRTLDNNIAFNVRIVPGPHDTHEDTVTHMHDYVKTFLEQGGMQVQFNVVNTDTLKDAMAHPDQYPDLMVRVSGYCGLFIRLQRDLQFEIIRRCEYGL